MYAANPSATLEVAQIVNQTVAAAATVNAADGEAIDIGQYEYLLVEAVMAVETGTVTSATVTLQESDTDTKAGMADVTGASGSFATPNAGEAVIFEVSTRGLKRYAGLEIAVVGGTSALITAKVWGVVRRDSDEVASLGAPAVTTLT